MDRIKRNIAEFIWQAREELGLQGDAQSDWNLAERCMYECGDNPITYEIAYTWLSQHYSERTLEDE